jgi:voltage-gated sodium channel
MASLVDNEASKATASYPAEANGTGDSSNASAGPQELHANMERVVAKHGAAILVDLQLQVVVMREALEARLSQHCQELLQQLNAAGAWSAANPAAVGKNPSAKKQQSNSSSRRSSVRRSFGRSRDGDGEQSQEDAYASLQLAKVKTTPSYRSSWKKGIPDRGHPVNLDVTTQHQRPPPTPQELLEGKSMCNRFKAHIESPMFDAFCGIVVLINIVFMCLQLEHQGSLAAVHLQMKPDIGFSSGVGDSFQIMEYIFTAWFLIELLFRIWVHGFGMFRSLYNVFDAAIVLATIIDALGQAFQALSGGTNVSFARLLRNLRLVKFMRAFRVATLFSELRVLIKTVTSSFMALLSSMVLLTLIFIASGILLAQLLSGYITETGNDYETRLWVYRHYGTGFRAVYTIFEVTLSGCWPNYARPVIEKVNAWYALFFVLYVVLVVFAVIRIVGALFLTATIKAAGEDLAMTIMHKAKERHNYSENLHRLLCRCFRDDDYPDQDLLTLAEVEEKLRDPEFRLQLQALGLEDYELSGLVAILDEGEGVTFDEFVQAAMRIKGMAKGIDTVLIMHQQRQIVASFRELSGQVRCVLPQVATSAV